MATIDGAGQMSTLSVWLDLVLLNCVAIVGSAGLSLVICAVTESWWGFLAMAAMIVFADYVWWVVNFNHFAWLP